MNSDKYLRTFENGVYSLVKKVARQTNRDIYLSVFRVYIGFHVFKKFAFQWPYLSLLYGPNSFAIWTNNLWGIPADLVRLHYFSICIIGAMLSLGMALGVGRRWTIFALFLNTEILQHLNGFCLDGGDNLLGFILLYLSFCDSFHYLAIDGFKTSRQTLLDLIGTNLGVTSILIHICLIYTISGWSKVFASQWRDGTAIYYLLSGDRFCGTIINHALASCIPFVYIATYGSMLWECSFPIAVFIRKIRIPFLCIGILMHIGIYIFMMINEFEVLFIMTFGLFFCDSDFTSLFRWIRKMKFYKYITSLTAFNLRLNPAGKMEIK